MADIFVSYKAEDRTRVSPLVDALKARGFSVWWDAHIGGGEGWREAIERELDAAECVIVVWSKRSITAAGSFVRDEASRAMQRHAYLPIKIDNVRPPLGFGECQALPLLRWKGDQSDPRFSTLLRAIEAKIAGETHVESWVDQQPGFSRRTAVAGAASVVALAGAGWFLMRPKGERANTIAVLPFANLSGDPAQAYLSDGMAEEIRTSLQRLGGLTVIGRTSSEAVRNDDAPTAAKKLRVANILTGSVRQSPSTIRISAELIDGTTGADRWSQDYDRTPGDSIRIETDIAESVASALRYRLLPEVRKVLTAGGTRSSAAQDLYLKGLALAARGDDQSLDKAVDQFDAATAIDPTYADAFASKAEALTIISYNAPTDAETWAALTDAQTAAQEAVRLAPDRASAQSALGTVRQWSTDFSGATAAFDKALQLGAGPDTLRRIALFRATSGAGSTSLHLIERATELDPLNPLTQGDRGIILYCLRRFPSAISALSDFLRERPDSVQHRSYLVLALIQTGALDEAENELTKISVDWTHSSDEALLATRRNDPVRAERAIARLIAMKQDLLSYQFAQIYAQRGKIDQAIARLTKAVRIHDSGLRSLPTDPFLDPLRNDSRFKALLAQLKFPATA
jgi:serine/threonine-protein kinase